MVQISLYSFAAVYNTVRGQPADDLATDIIAFENATITPVSDG